MLSFRIKIAINKNSLVEILSYIKEALTQYLYKNINFHVIFLIIAYFNYGEK
jgi:hypothetical protein